MGRTVVLFPTLLWMRHHRGSFCKAKLQNCACASTSTGSHQPVIMIILANSSESLDPMSRCKSILRAFRADQSSYGLDLADAGSFFATVFQRTQM